MKKLMICVDLNDRSFNLYREQLKNWKWSEWDEIYLIHGFKRQLYTDNFYFTSYPLEDQIGAVVSSVEDVLENFSKDLFKNNFSGRVVSKCLLSGAPKEALKDYAVENDIDDILIGTRGKQGIAGLFTSSFAEYMVRYAPCRIIILRDKEK